jgi:hypothetical protein
MTRSPESARPAPADTDLSPERLAAWVMGFVVKQRGSWEEGELATVHDWLRFRGFGVTLEELAAMARSAREEFLRRPLALYVCQGSECGRFNPMGLSEEARTEAERRYGCPVSFTDCQGACTYAPVATLRQGRTVRRICALEPPVLQGEPPEATA